MHRICLQSSVRSPTRRAYLINQRRNALPLVHQRLHSNASSSEVLQTVKDKALPQWDSMEGLMAQSMHVEKAAGSYIYEGETGKQYFDMVSGMFCCSIGHSRPDIATSVSHQLNTLAFSESRYAVLSIRAQVCNQLEEIMMEATGEQYKFFFCNGGSEANESAVRMARILTGRPKIVARNRSYHGSSLTSLSLSGDARRGFLETPGSVSMPGIVRVSHAFPKLFSWESVQQCLDYYEDTFEGEMPNTLAGFIFESVTSTSNGLLAPPPGYLSGIQSLCKKHGIITIVDEVLTGLGRTAKWFGFQHNNCKIQCRNCNSDCRNCANYEKFVPDMVCMAKNVSNGAVPLGVVAVRRPLADRFMKESIGIGSTYNAHPVALAAAHATLAAYKSEGILQRVQQQVAPQLAQFFEKSSKTIPVVVGTESRLVGALGALAVDMSKLKNPTTSTKELRNRLLKNGVYTLVLKVKHPQYTALSHIVFSPPFTASRDELDRALQGIEAALVN